jgi:hypothetical protein
MTFNFFSTCSNDLKPKEMSKNTSFTTNHFKEHHKIENKNHASCASKGFILINITIITT